MSNKLSVKLYRSLLRSARRLDATQGAGPEKLGLFELPVAPGLHFNTWHSVVRQQFAATRSDASSAGKHQDLALKALAQANQLLASLTAKPATAAEDEAVEVAPARPEQVVYSVGQVFRHKKYGYRGVIIGWDVSCKAGATWIASTGVSSLPHGTEQPFYHVLVDCRDRPEAQVSYVAQDNISILTTEHTTAQGQDAAAVSTADRQAAALARLVLHPLVAKHFAEYRPDQGYYVPSSQLQAEYPDDCPAAVDPRALLAAATPAVHATDLRSLVFSGRKMAATAKPSSAAASAAASSSDSEDEVEGQRPRSVSSAH